MPFPPALFSSHVYCLELTIESPVSMLASFQGYIQEFVQQGVYIFSLSRGGP